MPFENNVELIDAQLLNVNNYQDMGSIKNNIKKFDEETIPVEEFEKQLYEKELSEKINKKIKQLLSFNFGVPKTSKAITHERKTSKKYYYKLNNEEEILKFVDILNSNLSENMFNTFCEKKELYSTKVGERDKLQICACYHEEENYDSFLGYPLFVVEFYLIIGIRYHKIKSKQIGASIILSKHPVIIMKYNNESFHGLFPY